MESLRTPRRAVLMALTALLALAALAPASSSAKSKKKKKPNIVFVITDDQSSETLRTVKNLPKIDSKCHAPRGVAQPCLNELVRDHGINFSRMATAYPLCCPSRATMVSGQYGHNNGVRFLFQYQNMNKQEVLPVWLQRAGYRTSWIGKYQGPAYLGNKEPGEEGKGYPNGFDDFQGFFDQNLQRPQYEEPTASANRFYGYIVNHNGVQKKMPETPEYYQSDWITRETTKFIRTSSKGSKPFFVGVGYTAPHWTLTGTPDTDTTDHPTEGNGGLEALQRPPVPAPRHRDELRKYLAAHVRFPRDPNYNEADVSDKPAFVRNTASITPATEARMDRWQAYRLASLLSVDEGIQKIYAQLKKSGELDNTYIMYAGDNGWMQGNHRLNFTKLHQYEESTRVPFLVRGPDTKKARVTEPTSNVDWASTVLALAGAKAGIPQDGMSLTPYLRDPKTRVGRAIFYETTSGPVPLLGIPGYAGVKLGPWKYIEYTNGEKELYNIQKDPFELNSLHGDPNYAGIVNSLSQRVAKFRTCKGQFGPNACLVRGAKAPAAP